MSLGAAMGARIRAFVVFGALCALTIGLIVPTFSAAATSFRGHATLGCPHHAAAKAASLSTNVSISSERAGAPLAPCHSGFAGCPGCCLAAHAGAAVLPSRNASFARPERRIASRISYADYAASAIKPAAVHAANGARAPPAV